MCLKLAFVWFIFVSLTFFCLVWAECSHPTFWFSAKRPRKQQQKLLHTRLGAFTLWVWVSVCEEEEEEEGFFFAVVLDKKGAQEGQGRGIVGDKYESPSLLTIPPLFFFRFLISLLAHCERYWWTLFILCHNRGKGPLLWYHRLVHFMGGVSERVLILWEISTLIITFPFALLSYFLGRYFPCLL